MKPANLYLSMSGRIKIGDFGHVKVVEPERMASRQEVEQLELGDRRYVAPELIDVSSSVDLIKCDVFSLGAALYELACDSRLPVREEGRRGRGEESGQDRTGRTGQDRSGDVGMRGEGCECVT
eukprot:766100-Hanusia_phi.AAC.1